MNSIPNSSSSLASIDQLSDEEWEREIDLAFEKAVSKPVIEKGVGYCENVQCPGFLKGFFLYRHEGPILCPKCQQESFGVPEIGIPSDYSDKLFAEVRVEFCYEPSSKRYCEIAIVRDELWTKDYRTYTLQCPSLWAHGRALKIAEILLGNLNHKVILEGDLTRPPKMQEETLDLSQPLKEFQRNLLDLEEKLQNNCFLNEPVVPEFSEENTSLERGEESGSQSLPNYRSFDERSRIFPDRNPRRRALYFHNRQ